MIKRKEWIYRCDHCSRPYYSSSGCKKHEQICIKNEANKTCASCLYNNWGECLKKGEFNKDPAGASGKFFKNCDGWESLFDYVEGKA